jgi:hypothetical protein
MLSESLVISTVNPTENGGWLEISNPTAYTATTKNLYLANDDDDLFLWQMPTLIIRAGQTVRVAMNSNSTCDVLKRLRTNFDISDGQTVRLSDVRGNVWSEWGGTATFDFFTTGEMEHIDSDMGDCTWGYTPYQSFEFVVPQNVFSVGWIEWVGGDPQNINFSTGETVSLTAGQSVMVIFNSRHPDTMNADGICSLCLSIYCNM